MQNRKLFMLITITAGLVLAGCGQGSNQTPETVTQTVTATQTVEKTVTPTTSSESETAAEIPVEQAAPEPVAPQPEPVYTPPPVVGFTGAPNGQPQQLNKVIDYCLSDENYQRGSTVFTDGTTGWTTYCAGM